MQRAGQIAKQHPLLSLLFATFVIAALLFAANLARKTIYWIDPAHQAQEIEPWMTPRYIAKSWGVSASDLAAHLGIAERPDKRPTLKDIAEARGVSVERIMTEAKSYLAEHPQDP